MPESTLLERRDKAMFSLCLLTSARISSLQTARIKSIKYLDECKAWAFMQSPKTQKTKFSKKITSIFVGQIQDLAENVLSWLEFLKSEGFEVNDYLFPSMRSRFDNKGKPVLLLTKEMVKSQTQIRKALKEAFKRNGLAYCSPHKFRHSIARKVREGGYSTDMSIALAENFGQKNGLATLYAAYGDSYLYKQAALMKAVELE